MKFDLRKLESAALAQQVPLEAGVFLVANPGLEDPNFRRSVILLVEHDSGGSLGYVLTRPVDLELDELSLDAALLVDRVRKGGPVQLDTLHFLHTLPESELPGSRMVLDGVYWGGDFEPFREQLHQGLSDYLFLLGYAGWSPGQLESEMDQQSWLATPAQADEVFHTPAEQLWQTVLRRMGPSTALFSYYPEDPQLN